MPAPFPKIRKVTRPRGNCRYRGMEPALNRCFLRGSASPVLPALLAAAACCAAACGPRQGGVVKPSAKPNEAVNTGLSALASNAEAFVSPTIDPSAPMTDAQKAAWAQQSALNLEQLLKEGAVDDFGRPRTVARPQPNTQPNNTPPAPPRAHPPEPAPVDTPVSTGLGALAGVESEPTPAIEQTAIATDEPAATATTPTPMSPAAELAVRMAALLRPATGSEKPALTDAAALIPIEAAQPGVLATLDNADNPLATALAPVEIAALRQARTRLLSDPATPPELLSALRGSAAPPPAPAIEPFAITRAALCTRVTGFGRFDPYPSTTFVAGRAVRAIVYAELDGFKTRPARPGDPVQTSVPLAEQVSVQLSQTLSLYNDKDGLLAWHRPPQAVTETSRSARRDFYLIQMIELPSTLSIGRYNLKVTVADVTSGAEAEQIIPIDVVADPSLVRRSR